MARNVRSVLPEALERAAEALRENNDRGLEHTIAELYGLSAVIDEEEVEIVRQTAEMLRAVWKLEQQSRLPRKRSPLLAPRIPREEKLTKPGVPWRIRERR